MTSPMRGAPYWRNEPSLQIIALVVRGFSGTSLQQSFGTKADVTAFADDQVVMQGQR